MQWRVTHNIPEVTAEVLACGKAIEAARPTVLRAIGVQLLSWGFTDFRDKSEGKAAGGITWKPIGEGAIRTRLAARAPYRKQREELKALSAQQQNAAPNQVKAIQNKRQAIRARRKAMIATELSKARIGVDTGRLANSLIFGVADLKMRPLKQTTSVAPTNAVFKITDRTVEVGTVLDYAKHFDEDRTIFGPGFIDTDRAAKLDALTRKAQLLAAKRIAKHVQITGE